MVRPARRSLAPLDPDQFLAQLRQRQLNAASGHSTVDLVAGLGSRLGALKDLPDAAARNAD